MVSSHFLVNFDFAAAVPTFFRVCGYTFGKWDKLHHLFLSIATIYFALFS